MRDAALRLILSALLIAGGAALGFAAAADSAAVTAFKETMERMHSSMMIDYTGNADVDFARAMIPHHQGAIDMAEVELKYGKDPELRKMAEEIIAAQKKEIANMKKWLATRGG